MKIGILGCGNMGSSIAERLSDSHELFVYDGHKTPSCHLEGKKNVTFCDSEASLARQVKMLIVAVKPKDLQKVAAAIKGDLSDSQLIVSVLAGTPVAVLQSAFGKGNIIRTMPNLAVRYGQGVVGIAEGDHISTDIKKVVDSTLAPLGDLCWMPEKMIDALASLTGSGPAFSLLLIESMVEAAVAMGFNAQQGKDLVVQMLSGTLEMIKVTGKHPAELKLQVTSPGGTTIAGLTKLEEHAVRFGVQEAFLAAFAKARTIEASHS